MFASENVLLRIPVLPYSAGSVAPQRGAGMAVDRESTTVVISRALGWLGNQVA